MTNKEKYVQAFVNALEVKEDVVEGLVYQGIDAWDSVGHMSLVAEIEDAFDVEIAPVELIPENFNSAKSLWAMIERLKEEE